MKKRKLKYKNIFICALILIIIIVFLILIFKKNFKVELYTNEIEYGTDFDISYIKKATYKGQDVKNVITIEFNANKIGNTDIVIKYNDKIVKKKVKIVDTVNPTISLKGSDIKLLNGEEYKEIGYVANDNYDGDITDKVEIINNIDNKKDGIYEIIYKVKDSSGNKAEVKRTVTVTSIDPTKLSVKEFNLDGFYDNIKLKESEMQPDSYLNDFIFAGDSIPLYYGMYNSIKGTQIWNKNGINPETAKTNKININYGNSGTMLLIDAYKKYQPKISLITLGSNSAGWMRVEYYISEYKDLIEKIKEVSPNTKIIIQSIPPVDISLDKSANSLNNQKINLFNYYLLKMCSEIDVYFLNSAEALKDENGTCKKGLCQSDGIHQTKEGIKQLVLYLKSHALID